MTTMAPPRHLKVAEPEEPETPALPGLLDDFHIDTEEMMLSGVDTSSGPLWTVSEMASFFFARSSHWVRWLETEGRMVLDGHLIRAIRTASNARKYDLTLIEQIAHALASNGSISGEQLRQALLLVKIEAVMHGHLKAES